MDLKLLTYCQQTALKCFFVGAEWDLPLSLFFPLHIWAVSHFTLRVCQNSIPSAAKYHKNKHSHWRCWTSRVQQLTDSAWQERIRSRSFSTSSLDALTEAAPSPLDVSRLYSVSRLWRWYVVKNNNGRNTLLLSLLVLHCSFLHCLPWQPVLKRYLPCGHLCSPARFSPCFGPSVKVRHSALILL